MEQNFETTNVHLKWLDYIYNQVTKIQSMQRIAKEGCLDLMDHLQVPYDQRPIIIPDTQYKNLRFMILEIDIMISNSSQILKEKTEKYKERLKLPMKSIDDRSLFLKELKKHNRVIMINIQPFFYKTFNYVSEIFTDIIKDISPILYMPEDDSGKKRW